MSLHVKRGVSTGTAKGCGVEHSYTLITIDHSEILKKNTTWVGLGLWVKTNVRNSLNLSRFSTIGEFVRANKQEANVIGW